MRKAIFKFLDRFRPVEPVQEKKDRDESLFSTDIPRIRSLAEMKKAHQQAMGKIFQKSIKDFAVYHAMQLGQDSSAMDSKAIDQYKNAMDEAVSQAGTGLGSYAPGVPLAITQWFAAQSFIGYGVCGIMAQHWLIDLVCRMPPEDACRNGYELTINDGTEVSPELMAKIRKQDIKFKVTHHLEEFVYFSKVFGIRIMFYQVDSTDPDYYAKPFNIDGVRPGSYKGMVQIDPYWITPEFDIASSSDPASSNFYEPTWWRINNQRYHYTHLVIVRNCEVIDLLKPTYLYGGVPLPQRIFERVYAAERTANEAPHLAATKRTSIVKTDMKKYVSDPSLFEEKLQQWAFYRDNYAIKPLGTGEEYQQIDTALADVDTIIWGQYQIVAAIGQVPATKLYGIQPKGFNSTGEYEESSYHEHLKTIQTHKMTPVLDRHYLLLIRSEYPELKDVHIDIKWAPLDAPTEKELAETNKIKAETGAFLFNTGAIDGYDERQRIIADPASGYSGLISDEMPEPDPGLEPEDDLLPDMNVENDIRGMERGDLRSDT